MQDKERIFNLIDKKLPNLNESQLDALFELANEIAADVLKAVISHLDEDTIGLLRDALQKHMELEAILEQQEIFN